MGPLIEAVEARLLDEQDLRPIFTRGGDLEAGLRRLERERGQLESLRVRFRPLCLYLRDRSGAPVSLRPPT